MLQVPVVELSFVTLLVPLYLCLSLTRSEKEMTFQVSALYAQIHSIADNSSLGLSYKVGFKLTAEIKAPEHPDDPVDEESRRLLLHSSTTVFQK